MACYVQAVIPSLNKMFGLGDGYCSLSCIAQVLHHSFAAAAAALVVANTVAVALRLPIAEFNKKAKTLLTQAVK